MAPLPEEFESDEGDSEEFFAAWAFTAATALIL
jgi:hypothetical protein